MQSKTILKKAYLRQTSTGENVIVIKFPFNTLDLNQVKEIPGRKYNPEQKYWTAPVTETNIRLLVEFGWMLDDELKALVTKQSSTKTDLENWILSNPDSQYQLRDYQLKATAAALSFLAKPKDKNNAIMVLPTGSGKSLVIAAIAANTIDNILILQPSKELLEQNYEKFVSYGYTAGIYSASLNTKSVKSVTFATIGSIVNKPDLFVDFPVCIIDECHLVVPDEGSQYQTFLSQITAKVIGLTATPVRMKRYNFPEPHAKVCMLDRMRPRYFNQYIHITQISEMIAGGYFAKIDYRDVTRRTEMLRLNTTGADYTTESLRKWYRENGTDSTVIEIVKLPEHKHILVFVPDVEYAYNLSSRIPNSAVIESGINKDDRRRIITGFKTGHIKVIINVNVLTTGFDFPALDCVVLARPTRSLGLYYQMIGRGVRPAPGKEYTTVYDLGECIKRFGKVDNWVIERVDGLMAITSLGTVLTNVSISENYGNSENAKKSAVFTGRYLKPKP